jgi:hypothetical protein
VVSKLKSPAFIGILVSPTPHNILCLTLSPACLSQVWAGMFKKLFHYPRVISRHANAPLAEERNTFLSHLASRGTPGSTLLRYASQLRAISTMLGNTSR